MLKASAPCTDSVARVPNSPSSVSRQALLVVVGDGLTVAALLVTAMVLARTISTSDMATFRQATYVSALVVSVAELGISSTVYRYFRFFQGEQQKAFLWAVLVATTVLGGVGSVVLLALALPLARAFGNEALGSALFIVSAYPLVVMPFMLVRPMLICKGHSIKATLLETTFAVGSSLSMILPIRAGWTLNQSLALWIASNACRIPVSAWFMAHELASVRPRWDTLVVREVWSYTWPLQLSRVPGILMQYLDKVVTSLFLAKNVFAAYSLGARELPFLNGIPFSLSSVMLPQMVEALRENRVHRVCELWRKTCLSTAIVTFPFAAFALWYARPIVRVMFTATYDISAIPFSAYVGITFLRVVDYGSLAKTFGDNRIVLRGASIAALSSVPLSLAMTWLWGIWGISFSLLLSTLIMVVYYIFQYRALLKCPVQRFYPITSMFVVAILAFAAVSLTDVSLGRSFAIRDQVHTYPLMLRLSALLFLCGSLYVVALLVLRAFAPSFFEGLRLPGPLRRDA